MTRQAPDGGRQVLLGFKKRGFGAGRWVGIGGHIEDGESAVAAAVREVAEETSLILQPGDLDLRAAITFVFPARPSWDQTAEVFLTASFAGSPAESDEVIPRWFDVAAPPFDQMWDDAQYWLPAVLAGVEVRLTVTFADDCFTVATIN
jgi:8-oxo-dGTP diphosphatase